MANKSEDFSKEWVIAFLFGAARRTRGHPPRRLHPSRRLLTNRLLVRARVDDCVKQDRCEQEPDDVAADSQCYMLVWTLQLRRTITQDVLDEKNGDRVDSNSHTDSRSCPLNNIRSMKTQCIVQHPCQHSEPETGPVDESGWSDHAGFRRLRRLKSQIRPRTRNQ